MNGDNIQRTASKRKKEGQEAIADPTKKMTARQDNKHSFQAAPIRI
jgi:hypothetical protein